jgi:hypothetical protein
MGEIIRVHFVTEEEIRHRGIEQRSKPGKGEMVDLFLMAPFNPDAPGADEYYQRGDGRTIIHCSRGEDFADCIFPIAIKTKDNVENHQLIQCLLDLAQWLQLD